MLGPFARLSERVRSTLVRRGRIPGLRTVKATLAVVAAYLLVEVLHLSEHPIVAPLMALLVVQLTLYKTLMHGLGRIGGVLAGVLVAVGVAEPYERGSPTPSGDVGCERGSRVRSRGGVVGGRVDVAPWRRTAPRRRLRVGDRHAFDIAPT
jgi:fusaric acid resistance family protein